MNGIDIASWQANLNTETIAADFIIVKATEGYTYKNPYFKTQIDGAIKAGKRIGCYHYADGLDAAKEAQHFLDVAGEYTGKAIFCLDWESNNNASYAQHSAWCEKWIDYVEQKTGITPFIYISAGLLQQFKEIAEKYPMWIAQYPDYEKVNGYQQRPWNEGAYSCAIRQYTSMLYLDGYTGRLDGNKCYLSPAEWDAYTQPTKLTEGSTGKDESTDIISDTAKQVIAGVYGNGDERKQKIGEYFYNKVQSKVNEMLGGN